MLRTSYGTGPTGRPGVLGEQASQSPDARARRDLDPVLEVPDLLPWIILADVLRAPLDFRYRLIGSGVVDRSRWNYTGKRFSELPDIGPDSQLWKQRATVVETGAPLRSEPPYVGRTPGVHRVVVIHLPLSDDGETVNMIFTAVVFRAG
jgi:hypothetical protein